MTGGYISDRLRLFVENNLGHWEKQEYFCFKCGKPLTNENGIFKCKDCDVSYNKQ
jgi:ribosomal protein L37AE/L43A